jgi:hypothetical protein
LWHRAQMSEHMVSSYRVFARAFELCSRWVTVTAFAEAAPPSRLAPRGSTFMPDGTSLARASSAGVIEGDHAATAARVNRLIGGSTRNTGGRR